MQYISVCYVMPCECSGVVRITIRIRIRGVAINMPTLALCCKTFLFVSEHSGTRASNSA